MGSMSGPLARLVKIFPRASRLPFLAGSLFPALLGTVLAYREKGLFSLPLFTLLLAWMAGAHLAVNFFNDYFDYRYGVDRPHPPRPFSGGSQVIQEGLLTPGQILGQALVLSTLAIAALIPLVVQAGPGVLLLAFPGAFLGYFYSARPLVLSWRGLGELTTGLCFGPLAVAGSFFIQAKTLSPAALWFSLVPGGLIAAVLFVNQYPDLDGDRMAGKGSLVVRLGPRRAYPLLLLLLAAGFLPVLLPSPVPCFASFPGRPALLGLLPAAAAALALHRNVQASRWEDPGPGKLMLIAYSTTLLLLLAGLLLTPGG